MLRTLLHFLLLIAASWSQDTADDSVITKSPLRDNTFQRCLISKSDLSGCKVHRSQLISTSGKGSVISYSFLEKSTSIDSVLNATYPDSQLDATSTTDAFKNIDRYFFNRISNSDLLGAHIDASPQCYSSNRGFNSTIYHSRILYSTVRRSIVYKSNLTENSSSCLSGIVSSDLQSTRVSNSILQKLKGSSCTVSNSVVKHTNCEGSILSNSQTNSCSVKNTKMSNSVMSGNSEATNASLMNSVAKNSNLVGSQLTNSKVSNSKLTNCVITNSNVNNKVWDSVKMINGRIINDNRKNKQNNYY